MMQGVEISHLLAALSAVLRAYYDLMGSTIDEALRLIGRYGKKDTLGMDAMPEITIIERLSQYDANAVVVTEEIGSRERLYFAQSNHPRTFRTVYISDPTDRSNQLKEFLGLFQKTDRIGDVLRRPESRALWEEKYGAPADITGASSAISCVRRGVPIFSVIVNYLTQTIAVSCGAGNYLVDIPKQPTEIDLSRICKRGRRLTFPSIDGDVADMRRFVTFLGDAGKAGYRENFVDSGLVSEADMPGLLHYGKPGGPLRILYLSMLELRKPPIGFILANGEKIGEWIHWLPFVRFAKSGNDESRPALRLFEIYQDRPYTKEGVLMSTPPIYSVFKPHPEHGQQMIVDTGTLLTMPNPSMMRSTLLVAPFDNLWATRSVNQYGYRPLILFSEEYR